MSTYPNLRHARLLCACVSLNSVSRAAEAVGVSQPAASQALARLGDVYGAALIEQSDRGVQATPAGELVAARVHRALDLIRSGCARLRLPHANAPAAGVENRLGIPQLRAIAAFAEGGSFSAAARLLALSEPAVHKMARGLEDAIQVPLFEGAGRSIRLSTSGTSVARWARLALNEFDSAVDDVREQRGSFEGRIAVGTLPLSRTSLVPRAIVSLIETHPHARFAVAEGRYDDLLRDLEMGRIDVLIGALRPDFTSQTLRQDALFPYTLSVVARAGHPLANRTDITPDDLSRYPWILARPGTPSRDAFMALAEQFPQERPAQLSVESGSLVAIRGILMQTDHLTLLSELQIDYEMRAGFLTPLPFTVGGQEHRIGLTLRRNWHPTALQAAFVAALRAAGPDENASV